MWGTIVGIYTTFFYEPLFNLLVIIYNVLPGHDLALAIIVMTLLIRILLYPISHWSIKSQKMMQDLQPKISEINAKYKENKEKRYEETMKLYKSEKVNPLSSCLPLLIQLPFFIALFHVFQDGFHVESLSSLYQYVENPGSLNPMALWGFLDLSKRSIPLVVLVGAAQFWQGHMLIRRRPQVHTGPARDEDFAVLVNQQMAYVMPVVIMVAAWQFPAGVALYWFLTTAFMAVQQWYVFRRHNPSSYAALPPSTPTPAS
jgi:YidC/Oxa1 family membrane protein insertase